MLRQLDRSIEELCRAAVHYSSRTDSFPLETRVRERMEAAFRCDLSAIRLVSDCTGLNGLAPALASGKKILFAPGAYRPSEPSGLFLLAHEIAHNLQQHSTAWERRRGLVRNALLEAEADIVAAFAYGAVNYGSVCISDHFGTNCLSREAEKGVFQAKLLIDSNVSA